MTNGSNIRVAFEHARTRREFLASDLARYQQTTGLDDAGLAYLLETTSEVLPRLGLCRSPRRDEGFSPDVQRIARYVGVSALRLARTLRVVDAIEALRLITGDLTSSALTAARDLAIETASPELPPSKDAIVPQWLATALEVFWGPGQSRPEYPRDLELAVLNNLPLGIVEIEELSVGQLQAWFLQRDIDLFRELSDRRLRACIVVHGGAGLLFVDSSDTPAERRVSIAHEVGHFLNDYLLPRMRIARQAPQLLEIDDEFRNPTESEHIQALLAHVRLGVHTHLFERTAAGGLHSVHHETSEDRATRIAWELLAPASEVLARSAERVGDVERILREAFGLSSEVASDYARYLTNIDPSGRPFSRWIDDD